MNKKYQLRRIGLPPSIEEVRNIYSINQDTTFIGRGKCVDIYLDSSIRKGLISRAHAHLTRLVSNKEVVFRMYDTSLNGTYINDVRIKDFAVLKEGDKIAFGHLRGAIIDPGELAPQKETEFLFKFESCMKEEDEDFDENVQQKSSVFMSPKSLEPDGNSVPLLGLHQAFDYEKTSQIKDEGKWPKKILSDFNANEECELKSVVSSVTSKIYKHESSENELNIDIIPSNDSKEVTPLIHPNQRLLKLRNENISPFSSISSDTDIKRDTSLSLTHVYENVEESNQVLGTLKSKVNAVLNGHNGCLNVIDVSSSKSSDCQILKNDGRGRICTSDDNDEREDCESIFSDKSEEITDSEDSDSDYAPSSRGDSHSRGSLRRTRKAPQRFSPVNKSSNKKAKLNNDSAPTKKETRKGFKHDRCAAWDCIEPSGAIKQITWVACDDCDAWYHVTCSGLSTAVAKRPRTKYHCGCL